MTVFGKERLYAQTTKHQSMTATNQPASLYHSLPAAGAGRLDFQGQVLGNRKTCISRIAAG